MFRISKHNRRRLAWQAAIAASLLICLGQYAGAQNDLTEPPRIIEDTPAPSVPQVNDAAAEMEEIVVISDQNPWRLPDLGSSWRDQEADQRDTGRLSADLLPIWNPDGQEMPTRNPFELTDSFRRVGFIEVFRVRFGGQ